MKKLWDVFTSVVVALLALCAVLFAGVRIIGLTPYAVLSGSMEPSYHVGALVYVRKTDPAALQVGDAITYILDENLTVVTHRIVEIDPDGEHFYTKGDANSIRDGMPVHAQNIIGTPVFSIPYLGYFSGWITNPPGLYIGLCGGAALLLLMFLPNILRGAEQADKKAAQERAARKHVPRG